MIYPFNKFCRADMWAILGMYAVQKTIDNNNNKCSNCEEVPDLQAVYTHGRKVNTVFDMCERKIKLFNVNRTALLLPTHQMLKIFLQQQ